jgi:murein L,D-transpeptidase YafK
LNRSPRIRSFLSCAGIAAAIALGGCQTDGTDLSARARAPIPSKMLAAIEQKNMDKDSPILIRTFKQEAELEVWKQDRTGRYALLKTYPICRWSGELGPKIKEGDRQAPEGFYSITPAQMNPKSQYFLAFNMGYPNAYDRAWNRTGAELMIHGDCSSRGCYAMTDEQISEIYALGREAFFGGQRAFQVQAYPFRMTPANFAKHRNNPHLAFWKMLKRGHDHFEVTRLEPKVDVCEKQYVFDAQAPANASGPLAFNPTGKCPAYEVSEDIVVAVHEKQRRDEFQTAELVTRGAKTSPIRTGTDGGMHPVFLAALQKQGVMTPESPLRIAALGPTPGTIPQHVVPPRAPQSVAAAPAVTSVVAVQPPAPPAQAKTAAAAIRPALMASSQRPASANLLAAPSAGARSANASAARYETTGAIASTKTAPTVLGAVRPQTAKTAASTAAPIRSAEGERQLQTDTSPPSSAPMPPAGSFESRWSAITGRGRF